jgi:hypothetical protein
MGDENKTSLLFTTRFQEKFHDVAGGTLVQVARGFVGHNHLGAIEQGTGDGHTLTFAA